MKTKPIKLNDMKYEIKAEQLDKIIEKQKELIDLLDRYFLSKTRPSLDQLIRSEDLKSELSELEQETTEGERIVGVNYFAENVLKEELGIHLKDSIKNKTYQKRFHIPCDFPQDEVDMMIDEAIDEYFNQ